jgi:hypothetical protein
MWSGEEGEFVVLPPVPWPLCVASFPVLGTFLSPCLRERGGDKRTWKSLARVFRGRDDGPGWTTAGHQDLRSKRTEGQCRQRRRWEARTVQSHSRQEGLGEVVLRCGEWGWGGQWYQRRAEVQEDRVEGPCIWQGANQ